MRKPPALGTNMARGLVGPPGVAVSMGKGLLQPGEWVERARVE